MSRRGSVASGRKAEEKACRYLEDRGYRVVGRNVRAGRREIDIIARRDDTLVVVEVRSKRSHSPLLSSEIVGFGKRVSVASAAREVIGGYRKPEDSVRFDVIIVAMDETGAFAGLDHIENAFSAGGEII